MNYRLLIIFAALAFARPFGWCMVRAMVPESEIAVAMSEQAAQATAGGCHACSHESSEPASNESESDESEHPCCQRDSRIVSPKPVDADSAPAFQMSGEIVLEFFEPPVQFKFVSKEQSALPASPVDRSAILLRLSCALLI